jgi:hypothetical protein
MLAPVLIGIDCDRTDPNPKTTQSITYNFVKRCAISTGISRVLLSWYPRETLISGVMRSLIAGSLIPDRDHPRVEADDRSV